AGHEGLEALEVVGTGSPYRHLGLDHGLSLPRLGWVCQADLDCGHGHCWDTVVMEPTNQVLDPQATDWSTEGCTIEAALNVVGDRQTVLIVREILTGKRRFSEILDLTGLSRQVLSNRLARLLDQGLVRRHTYQAPGSRPRDEYRLTDKGFD